MKTLDFVDVTLAVGLVMALGTVCALSVMGADTPPVLENIMWGLAMAFGAKKIPQKL